MLSLVPTHNCVKLASTGSLYSSLVACGQISCEYRALQRSVQCQKSMRYVSTSVLEPNDAQASDARDKVHKYLVMCIECHDAVACEK